MIGTVIAYNIQKGMVAVDTDNGITVFELLGGYQIDIGDIIRGNLDTHAGEELFNVTKKEKVDVFIEGIQCSVECASNMLK